MKNANVSTEQSLLDYSASQLSIPKTCNPMKFPVHSTVYFVACRVYVHDNKPEYFILDGIVEAHCRDTILVRLGEQHRKFFDKPSANTDCVHVRWYACFAAPEEAKAYLDAVLEARRAPWKGMWHYATIHSDEMEKDDTEGKVRSVPYHFRLDDELLARNECKDAIRRWSQTQENPEWASVRATGFFGKFDKLEPLDFRVSGGNLEFFINPSPYWAALDL